MTFDLDNAKNWQPFLNEAKKSAFFGSKIAGEAEDRRVWLKSRLLARN
jgi:hypothetical protein